MRRMQKEQGRSHETATRRSPGPFSSQADRVSARMQENAMNRFAHRASRRLAEVESEFAHARRIVAPALLWVATIVLIALAAALQDTPVSGPAQTASPEAAAVVPLGA